MRIAYFDCFAGLSGDMAVGALIDAGVPLDVIRDGLALIGINETELTVATRRIVRSQIAATKFDVLGPNGQPVDRLHGGGAVSAGDRDHMHGHGHGHDHDHGHDHGHHHDHAHHHGHDHGHGHHHDHEHHHGPGHEHGHHHDHAHRTFADIRAMIERSALAERVKQRAVAIFGAIAEGEGRVHDMPPEQVGFHEVGALDSVADIVAVAIGLEHLGIDAVYASELPLGSGGMIRTQHGLMPLPAPATLAILKGRAVRLTDVPMELTTPTGAGIVAALSCGTLGPERIIPERFGFGAGTRELADRPNLVRVIVGELAAEPGAAEPGAADAPGAAWHTDVVTVIEANIDDMNPQLVPYAIERLLAAGAVEAYAAQVLMKKGRPGLVLTAIAPPELAETIAATVFAETTTIGLRMATMERRKLPRVEVEVPTAYGPVRMKRINTASGTRVTPEFEDARRIAAEQGLPIPDVHAALSDAARRYEATGEA